MKNTLENNKLMAETLSEAAMEKICGLYSADSNFLYSTPERIYGRQRDFEVEGWEIKIDKDDDAVLMNGYDKEVIGFKRDELPDECGVLAWLQATNFFGLKNE